MLGGIKAGLEGVNDIQALLRREKTCRKVIGMDSKVEKGLGSLGKEG